MFRSNKYRFKFPLFLILNTLFTNIANNVIIYIYIYSWLVVWLVGLYYLTPNPFLYKWSVLFQIIQFSMTTLFNCQNISISSNSV